MPAKNIIKTYSENCFYHIYNRGVEKRDIFLDESDFAVFLSYVKTYLLPKDVENISYILTSEKSSSKEKFKAERELMLKNFSSEIDLVAYCLMLNHFHLLIRQQKNDSMNRFMQALITRYTLYFNKKYKRVGPLFQGTYKAVLIRTEEQLLHVSRYIHLNPFVKTGLKIKDIDQIKWPFSLPDYLNLRNTSWLKRDLVLNYFSKTQTYEDFMEEFVDLELFDSLVLDLNEE